MSAFAITTTPEVSPHFNHNARHQRLGLLHLAHEVGIVGAEIVEVNPFVDPGYTTALVANRCLIEMITGVAMRKAGLPGPHYLDPGRAGDRWYQTP